MGSTVESTEHDAHSKDPLGLDKKESSIDAKKGINSEFVCKHCNKAFRRKQALMSHKNLHTGEKPYKCVHCPKAYISRSGLKYHKLEHKGGRPFVCDICAKTFKIKEALTSHIKHVHKYFNTNDNVSKAYKRTTKVSPESKMARMHTTEGDEVINERDRIDHQADAHPKGPLGLDRKESCIDARKGTITEFVCKYCNKVFGRKRTLMNHENLHTGEKPYKCEQCTQAFSSPQSLAQHKITHNSERRPCCDRSGKTFQGKASLNMHMEIHVNPLSHVCSICNKRFNQRSALMRHVQSHINSDDKMGVQKPYKCDQCPKAYVRPWGLSYHKLGHRKERPFVCNICAKTFKDKGGLNLHMVCHVNAQSNVCSICGKGFNCKSNMRTHMRRIHNNGDNDKPKISIKKS